MREVILKIPDNKFDFFMELVRQLGIKSAHEINIPDEHKNIVRERIKNSNDNPERLLDWDHIQDEFKFD